MAYYVSKLNFSNAVRDVTNWLCPVLRGNVLDQNEKGGLWGWKGLLHLQPFLRPLRPERRRSLYGGFGGGTHEATCRLQPTFFSDEASGGASSKRAPLMTQRYRV